MRLCAPARAATLRLSTPRLGTNGIGKSTALNVLSGKLKPNLGKPKEPPDWHEILAYYRGSELQKYFTRMLEDDLRVSIKARPHGSQCPALARSSPCGRPPRRKPVRFLRAAVSAREEERGLAAWRPMRRRGAALVPAQSRRLRRPF